MASILPENKIKELKQNIAFFKLMIVFHNQFLNKAQELSKRVSEKLAIREDTKIKELARIKQVFIEMNLFVYGIPLEIEPAIEVTEVGHSFHEVWDNDVPLEFKREIEFLKPVWKEQLMEFPTYLSPEIVQGMRDDFRKRQIKVNLSEFYHEFLYERFVGLGGMKAWQENFNIFMSTYQKYKASITTELNRGLQAIASRIFSGVFELGDIKTIIDIDNIAEEFYLQIDFKLLQTCGKAFLNENDPQYNEDRERLIRIEKLIRLGIAFNPEFDEHFSKIEKKLKECDQIFAKLLNNKTVSTGEWTILANHQEYLEMLDALKGSKDLLDTISQSKYPVVNAALKWINQHPNWRSFFENAGKFLSKLI
nr:hypothetical protein [Candidatus Sigynarchaeota archaeon]